MMQSMRSSCRRTARFWWVVVSRTHRRADAQPVSPDSIPTTGLADSFNPNANRRCGTIAVQADGKILVGGDFRYFGPAPSAARRATISLGLMPPRAWPIRSTRTHTNPCERQLQSRCRRTERFWSGGSFSASADRPATSLPARCQQPAWRIRSIRTLAGDAGSHGPRNCGAGGREDSCLQAPSPVSRLTEDATVTRNHIARLENDGRLDQTLNLDILAAIFLEVFTPALCSRTARFSLAATSRTHRFGRDARLPRPLEYGRHGRHSFQTRTRSTTPIRAC